MCHVLKFISFVNRNNDIPFFIKKKIFDAAITTSVLYGCESLLNCDIKPIEKQYKWCIKQLLGVRKTTNNDVCMVEIGLPSLRVIIKAKQINFFHKMWPERNTMDDDPLMHAVRLAMSYNDQVSRYINDLNFNNVDDVEEDKQTMRLNITNSVSNILIFYKRIHPNLVVHEIYKKQSTC